MNPQPELLLHIVARIKESPEAAAEFERSISFLLGQGDGATAILTVRHLIAGGWNVESMQKLLDTLTLNVPADGGRDEPVFYLDFDGVLHPYPTEDGHFEIPEESLFRFAPLLEAQLEPYPQVKIVLSTTWAKNKTGPGALLYLKPGLQQRVVGATWDQQTRSYHVPVEDRERRLSRFEQIAADVAWRKPSTWFALEDDFKEWPSDQHHHLGWCWMTIGFNEPRVQEALQDWLDSLGNLAAQVS